MVGLPTIGAYKILRKIGEGGMGAVYLGEHTLLGRKAAIKVLLPSMSADQNVLRRFFNEARAVTQIADPGIVQVFDFGHHTDGSAFIVMELLEGESLTKRLHRIKRFSVEDCMRLVRMAATSLAAAHAKGIVHRDLKPDNIFIVGDPAVTGGERPKILDFGIAKLSGETTDMNKTRTGALIGTPLYMSPEQCRGAGEVDQRSDIYSIACVMFKLLTGVPPFDGRGSGEVIAAHLREPPPFAAARVPELPDMIDLILQRCLQKDPAQRFQNMTERFAQALGQAEQMLHHASQPTIAVEGSVTPAPAPEPSPPAPPSTITHASGEQPARLRVRVPIIIAAAVTTIAVVIAGTMFAKRSGASSLPSPPAVPAAPADAMTPTVNPAVALPQLAPPAATPRVDAGPTPRVPHADASHAPIDAGKMVVPPERPGHRVGKPAHASSSAEDIDRGD